MKRRGMLSIALLLPGSVGLLIGAFIAPSATLAAYLGGFAFALSLSLGCLFLVLIAHATAARWMLVYRRMAEVGGTTLFALFPAFIPILLGAPLIYGWTNEQTHPWLDLSFFIARALGYFAVWIVVAEVLFHFGVREDPALPGTTARLRTFSAASIWPIVLTFSFATFDWFMSLDKGWISSIYPVYFFAGSLLAALALLGAATPEPNPTHRHNIGKLELTFVIFWAYIAFCQLLIIWIADLPKEVVWYLARFDGGWGTLGIALIAGHFAIPFFVLLPQLPKRRRSFLIGIGGWLLLMHWIDIVWIVVPSADPRAGANTFWLHASALLFFSGLLSATAAWRGAGVLRYP